MKTELTAERLRELLHYNPETGSFSSIKTKASVGSHQRGYCYVNCAGKSYLAHRLAWLYIHGEWPKNQIDHMNGDRGDNRIANLRDVPAFINYQNQRKARSNNISGLLGVAWDKARGKWMASIRKSNGKNKYLGRYDSPDIAHAAYMKAKRELHIGCMI